MRIIAKGKYEGREVEVAWKDGDLIDGDSPAIMGIIHYAISVDGKLALGHPEIDLLYEDYLTAHFGFTYVAMHTLEDVKFEFPDGKPPPYPDAPPGTV